jgi:hypothetical protein
MKKLETFADAELPVLHNYPMPSCRVSGLVRATLIAPADSALRLCHAELGTGAELRFGADHDDEGVFVESGGLTVGDAQCPAGGAVIIEAGVTATVRATCATRILHVGRAGGAADAEAVEVEPAIGRVVHVVGPRGWFQSGASKGVGATWFADSTCPTCRISLLTVTSTPRPIKPGPRHSHSAEELIYVLAGEVRLGRQEYGPGSTLFVPADVQYALSHGPDGVEYLNYRAEPSEQSYFGAGTPDAPVAEGGLVRGGREIGDLVNVGAERS